MSTPVKPSGSSVPAVPAPSTPLEPVPVLAPLGWLLILIAGVGLMLSTWILYPIDYDGMWAGYRDGTIATVVVVCAMALRTTLPAKPILGLLCLCGMGLVLLGIFLDNPTEVLIAETVAGALLLAGTALYASGELG